MKIYNVAILLLGLLAAAQTRVQKIMKLDSFDGSNGGVIRNRKCILEESI